MPRFDEDLTPEQWNAQERHDEAEQIQRDEEEHRFREDALEVLEAVREELDQRSDAEYVDGVPRGNWAMSLLGDVDRVIAKGRAK